MKVFENDCLCPAVQLQGRRLLLFILMLLNAPSCWLTLSNLTATALSRAVIPVVLLHRVSRQALILRDLWL